MSEGIRRRDFLKVVGAGGAGASVFGCSTQEVERLIPYVVAPEEITPGVATWYSSVCGECPAGCGTWVRTREGRAVKLEGNPNHPVSGGALCSRGHSSLQALYSPDRYAGPLVREGGEHRGVGWDEAEEMLAGRLAASEGNVMLLSGRTGPAMSDLMDRFVAAVGGERVEYDALSEAPLREATRIAYGRDVVPSFEFEAARFVVSFGADFLETWLSPVEFGRGFARASGVDERGDKTRFVLVGSRLSLTGLNADEWVPVRPGSEGIVALGMAHVLARRGADAGPYAPVLEAYDPRTAGEATGLSPDAIEDLADRFAAEAPGLAVGPGVAGQHRSATAANLAVLVLNHVAGNVGRTVRLQAASLSAAAAPYASLESALPRMAGAVVLVHGANPAHTLPPAAGFREALASAAFRVSFASAPDETSALADLILPDRHWLEAWGDSSPRPGLHAVQQPVMQTVPHFDAKQTGDVLLSVAARAGRDLGVATFYEHLRARWRDVHAASGTADEFDVFWRDALRRGVVRTPLADAGEPTLELRAPDRALSFDPPSLDGDGEFVLMVYPSPRFGDGTQANRPWLQELPDPVSKVTWHSWVELNPAAAGRLGLRNGDVVRVRSPHGELEVPLWTYPGIREDTVAIAMGGGRESSGRFADGHGVNPMVLLPAVAESPSGGLVHLATRVTLEPTGRRRRLAAVEGSADQHGRPIVPAVALGALGSPEPAGPDAGHGELKELQGLGGFAPVPTEGRAEDFPLAGAQHGEYDPTAHPRWAMAIDLDKCTGCSACITACQAENNVPWVGEDLILMGRDMHWVRLERYYETVDASRPGPVDVRFLPMICQHCGNAPCEPVCPVFAAYHTPDGINAQVYNRCVGTRYCANNCPYKVRVFNWYTYTDVPEPMNWQYNPDVTVRENGVMEKCTFCIQRVRDAQNRARLEDRQVRDGEVLPACQQSCPAEAIVFGDIRNPDSAVARVVRDERTYRVLDELINTQPAVSYLKKVTFHPVESGAHG